jgi:hypothetical protein
MKNERWLLTATALLTGAAAILYIARLVVYPLHEDVAYVLHVTRSLVHGGDLKNSGLCFAFQTLRPDFHATQPFFAHYLAAVFYFWPFFKLFGATDFAFFFAQTFLLVVLGGLLAMSGLGWRWAVLTIAIGILARTFILSIVYSPTQLLAISLIAYFWLHLEKPAFPHPVVNGFVLGLSAACRPEAFFSGLLALVLITPRLQNPRRRLHFLGVSLLSTTLFMALFETIRRLMGGVSDYDNKLVLLFADVIAPRFDVLGVSDFPALGQLIHDPLLRTALIQKLFHNIGAIWHYPSLVWGPGEVVLMLSSFLLIATRNASLRKYLFVYALWFFQIMVNAALIPLSRHYDAAFFFILCAVLRDTKRFIEIRASTARQALEGILFLGSIALVIVTLRILPNGIKANLLSRHAQIEASEEAHRHVPADAFVITDMPELWLWYGQGKMCVFVPWHHPETMRKLLTKFPQAYMVMFLGEQRAGYPLQQFRRPLLSHAHHVMIYGPGLT